VGLGEVAVVGTECDLAGEEEKDAEFEFGSEGDGKPDAVGLGRVGDGEAEAGETGAEERADCEGEVAGHGGADENGLIGGGIDVGVALPGVVAFVAGAEIEVEDFATVALLAAKEVELVLRLIF
jgi:hypothetical protein